MDRLGRVTPIVALVFAGVIGAGVALAGAALVGGLDGTNTVTVHDVTVESSSKIPTTFKTDRPLTIAEIYKRTAPGVVLITATSTSSSTDNFFNNPFGTPQSQQQRALGSGFVIDKSGYIITNYHVVEGARSIQVTFSNNASIKARLVGSDPSTDIAVLRVNTNSRALTPLVLGDSDRVQVGDSVVAIGNPFGLSRTVTAGIVSAIQREIAAPNDYAIEHVIQTDAPINHGNSGGPLINTRGEVIGVNAQIETGGTAQGNVGVGFSIPSNTVSTVVAQLIKNGKVEHAYIGVLGQDLTAQVAKVFRLPVKSGVLIATVQPGTGAAEAGLKGGTTETTVAGESYRLGGDIIVAADGMKVRDLAGLRDIIAAKKPGDTITLTIYRSSNEQTVEVKLGRQPSSPSG
jgi:S1-C subfamily serine protease